MLHHLLDEREGCSQGGEKLAVLVAGHAPECTAGARTAAAERAVHPDRAPGPAGSLSVSARAERPSTAGPRWKSARWGGEPRRIRPARVL